MCRIVAYLGPPLRLDALVLEGDHALLVQSYRPREMREALLNADGFGVAWYANPDVPTPALYRTAMPMWGDDNLPRFAPHVVAPAFLANARSATRGMAVSSANVSPFVHGPLAFTHNGLIQHFRARVERPLRSTLSDDAWGLIEGHTDSEHLFAAFVDRWRAAPALGGAAGHLADALAGVVELAGALAAERGLRALLNVAATDGRHLVAARYARGAEAPSLYRLAGGPGTPFPPGSIVVASEPLVPALPWTPFAEGELLVGTLGGAAAVRALDLPATAAE